MISAVRDSKVARDSLILTAYDKDVRSLETVVLLMQQALCWYVSIVGLPNIYGDRA